ncbi:hypothetical protein IEO21_06522 [Rhodonia placenta]|uniref:Protein kinase domain-containing protein n=1 Tax=Rhodonia placenta TaxID=104341 RepID=A0A8H7NZT9_9APHY|nr:hypothetical protein IEO21_06522 [Postia placenta]
MYASPSGLGWDTTMRCVTNGAEVDDGSTRYDIDVRSSDGTTTTYRTIRLLSDTGSEYLRGKGTRVWLVRKMEDGVECGEPLVLKDSWVDSNLQTEGDNLHTIRNCETDPPTGDLLDKYLLTVSCHGKVYVDGKLDHTLCHLSDPKALHTRLRFRLQTSLYPPGATVKTLALQLLHRRGWVHCDISTGNIMVMRKDGVLIVKLVDLELAESMAGQHKLCHYIGTPGFIAEEVAAHRYTHGGGRLGESTEKPIPVSMINAIFRYNPLHDLESIWWVAYYYIYRRIVVSVDGTPVLADDESQREWPCEARHCARRTFYDRSVRSHMLSQYLPIADLYCCLHKSVLGIAKVIQKLKRRLVEVYFEAEEDWRTIDHAVGEKHDLTNTFADVFEMIAIKQPRGIMIGRFGALTEAKQADNAVHEDDKSATSSETHSTDQESD